MPSNEDINNIGTALSDAPGVISNSYAERINPLGQAVANFASALGFGNSTTFGTAQPSTTASSKITPGTHTPGYGTDTNVYGNISSQFDAPETQALDPEAYRAQMEAIYQKYGPLS